jgi:hypothetical protein
LARIEVELVQGSYDRVTKTEGVQEVPLQR